MKRLIVNADDFGASSGVNRGILEGHEKGIVTSASLMVEMPGSEEAAARGRKLGKLSVGLHFVLTEEGGAPRFDLTDRRRCGEELRRQVDRFGELTGGLPSHLDSHHNIHRRAPSVFLELSEELGRPLREHSRVRYFPDFYGQWDGETHLEQISVSSLKHMLAHEIHDGLTELSCHPGYLEPDFSSSYALERETELETLCHPELVRYLEALDIELINYDLILSEPDRPRVAGGSKEAPRR